MKVLNQGLAILLSITVIAGAVIVVLMASNVIEPADLPEGLFGPQMEDISEASNGSKAIVIVVSTVIILAMLLFSFLELRSNGRQ